MKEITNIDELHGYLFSLMLKLRNYCDANGINYMLAGGTCLGAVRHNGFIPWDDDVDFFMLRPDYEKFLETTRTNPIDEDTEVLSCRTTPERNGVPFPYPFIKVVDKKSHVSELHYKPFPLGIFIDVFPIDGVPDSMKLQRKLYLPIERRKNLIYGSFGRYEHRDVSVFNYFFGCIGTFFLHCVFRPLRRRLAMQIDIMGQKYKLDECSKAGCVVWGYGYKKEVLDKAFLSSSVDIEFNGELFKIPAGYDNYLSSLYGNYMELPPEEKRITHSFSQVVKYE